MGEHMALEIKSRDLVAIAIIVIVGVLLILGKIGVDQALTIIVAILTYYFGYVHGYSIGKRGREK